MARRAHGRLYTRVQVVINSSRPLMQWISTLNIVAYPLEVVEGWVTGSHHQRLPAERTTIDPWSGLLEALPAALGSSFRCHQGYTAKNDSSILSQRTL